MYDIQRVASVEATARKDPVYLAPRKQSSSTQPQTQTTRRLNHADAPIIPQTQPANNPKRLTARQVRVHEHLPRFAHSGGKWKRQFQPTLTGMLYTSTNPFADFTLESHTLVTKVQQAVDAVYGMDIIGYVVEPENEPFCLLVCISLSLHLLHC